MTNLEYDLASMSPHTARTPSGDASCALAPHERPEAELLLCCARTRLDSEKADPIEVLLQEDMDWEYLLRAAHWNGMMPLLYSHLNATCSTAVPPLILKQLREDFHENTKRNLFLTAELLRILSLLEARGILAIPYKGPVMAASVYGSLALRQFIDLDILVRQRDVPTVRDALISEGYSPQFHLNDDQEEVLLKIRCEHAFARNDDSVLMDVHWAIVPRHFSFAPPLECLFERLEPVVLAGRKIQTLSTHDLLLVLCLHGAKHQWEQLIWICDVARLIEMQNATRWDQLMKQTSTLRSERMLFLGLFLASDLLGAVLPEEIWRMVRSEPVVKSLAAQVRADLFREAPGSYANLERIIFQLRTMEGLADRGKFCWDLVLRPTPLEWALVRLPAPLFPFYYGVRPIRLTAKYARVLWNRLQ